MYSDMVMEKENREEARQAAATKMRQVGIARPNPKDLKMWFITLACPDCGRTVLQTSNAPLEDATGPCPCD